MGKVPTLNVSVTITTKTSKIGLVKEVQLPERFGSADFTKKQLDPVLRAILAEVKESLRLTIESVYKVKADIEIE